MLRRPSVERGAHQIAFGARAEVQRESVEELRRLLQAIGNEGRAASASRAGFAELSGIHFARLLLLEDERDCMGRLVPASLVLMTEVDSPLARHVDELADITGSVLDATFGLCSGYPATPTISARTMFLREHRLKPQAVYTNTVGRTLQQIRDEEHLRQAIERFLDDHAGELRGDAVAARAAIQRFVKADPSLAWARRRAPSPPLSWRAREMAHAAGAGAALVLATPVLLVVIPLWAIALRWHEAHDDAPHLRPSPEHVRCLGAIEDHTEQNQFSAIGLVKPGWFRRITIAAVLRLIDYAARHVFNRADLAGVKTIHFARWTMLDDQRRAIFTSNYDGSVESYMNDFIDKVAFGLNASFSHGVGYPRTRFLFFEGAKREEEFKDFLRRHQIPTQVWYAAYADLSARNLENNALIRSGLFGAMTEADAAAWLRRL